MYLAPQSLSPNPGCYTWAMERKIFWLVFAILGLIADYFLPLWWALGATIPIGILKLVGGLPFSSMKV